MIPLDTSLYGSFSYPSPTGAGHSSITPAISVAGLQQVTSSMWQPPRPLSPPLTSAMDTLSTGQAVEIYQLAIECQALRVELSKQFQNLSGLEAIHHTVAQATAHETMLGTWPTMLPSAPSQPISLMQTMRSSCTSSVQRPTEHGSIQMMSSSPIN